MLSRRTFTAGFFGAPLAAAVPSDPADLSVTEAAALIRRHKLTPVELTQACLNRIEKLNPRLNAFITVTAAEALAGAKSLRPSLAAGKPLHGIPIALKDLYDTAGIRTTAASALWRDRVPGKDAAVVERLKAAGCILVGKANLDEFAYHFTSETSAFGASHNPWNPECSPGGSSGGSAITVATGMSLAALGSDTGGSIRLPAAFCGITGYKPTYGRVSTDGVVPLAWSLDHVGPMTRTAQDAALLHGVLSGQPVPLIATRALRVGVPRDPYWRQLDEEVERTMNEALKIIGRLSRTVRDVSLPVLPTPPDSPLPAAYLTVIFAEAYAFHREMLDRNPDSYHALEPLRPPLCLDSVRLHQERLAHRPPNHRSAGSRRRRARPGRSLSSRNGLPPAPAACLNGLYAALRSSTISTPSSTSCSVGSIFSHSSALMAVIAAIGTSGAL